MKLISHFNIRNLLLGLLGSVMLNSAMAATPEPVVEGTDYTLLTKVVTKSPEPKGHVNVKEFFSFVCIHCKDVEPLVASKLLTDKTVDVDRIHVAWNPDTEGYAKLNATLQIMKLDKLYTPVFTATFSQHNLNNPIELKSFLATNGLTPDQVTKFMSTYDSFTVNSKVSEYKAQMDAYDVTGTPTFVVADKYVVSPALPDRAMQVVQYLVKKASTEK